MIHKKDMIVDLYDNTIAIPTIGVISIDVILDAYERIQQRKGIEIAKKEKKHLGRPSAVPNNFMDYYNKVERKEITVVDAIKQLNISRSGYYKIKQRIEQEQKK